MLSLDKSIKHLDLRNDYKFALRKGNLDKTLKNIRSNLVSNYDQDTLTYKISDFNNSNLDQEALTLLQHHNDFLSNSNFILSLIRKCYNITSDQANDSFLLSNTILMNLLSNLAISLKSSQVQNYQNFINTFNELDLFALNINILLTTNNPKLFYQIISIITNYSFINDQIPDQSSELFQKRLFSIIEKTLIFLNSDLIIALSNMINNFYSNKIIDDEEILLKMLTLLRNSHDPYIKNELIELFFIIIIKFDNRNVKCKESIIEYFGIQSLHSIIEFNKSKESIHFEVYLGSLEILNCIYSIINKNVDLVCLLFNSGIYDVIQEYIKLVNFKNNSRELELLLRMINLIVSISSQEIEKYLFNRNLFDFFKKILSKTNSSTSINMILTCLCKYTTDMTNSKFDYLIESKIISLLYVHSKQNQVDESNLIILFINILQDENTFFNYYVDISKIPIQFDSIIMEYLLKNDIHLSTISLYLLRLILLYLKNINYLNVSTINGLKEKNLQCILDYYSETNDESLIRLIKDINNLIK